MRKEDIKVAIIIPAYNVETYISRGLESCINQTYMNIEIIVIDDGSSDNTYTVVEQYAKKDNRIVLYRQENQGVSSARNQGINLSSAQYAIFLDSDDWIELDAVEKMVEKLIMAGPESTLIASNCFYAKRVENRIEKEIAPDSTSVDKLQSKDALMFVGKTEYKLRSSCYKLFSLKVIKENSIVFEKEIKHGEDGLFVFEYLKHVDAFLYFPIPLWNILERPESATTAAYNKDKLTAIIAIEKMLNYDNDTKLQDNLNNIKVKRIVGILGEAVLLQPIPRNDVIFLRKKLRDSFKTYMKTEKNLKYKLICCFEMIAPCGVIAFVLKKREKRNK